MKWEAGTILISILDFGNNGIVMWFEGRDDDCRSARLRHQSRVLRISLEN
jgi:hypothetical protein